MPDARDSLMALRLACDAIVRAGGDSLHWEWDGRFAAALSPFPVAVAPALRAELEAHLPARWASDTIGAASPTAHGIARAFGGLAAGQEMFLTDSEGAVGLVACWWPWGSGDRISLRLKLLVHGGSPAEEDGLRREFRSWFGL